MKLSIILSLYYRVQYPESRITNPEINLYIMHFANLRSILSLHPTIEDDLTPLQEAAIQLPDFALTYEINQLTVMLSTTPYTIWKYFNDIHTRRAAIKSRPAPS